MTDPNDLTDPRVTAAAATVRALAGWGLSFADSDPDKTATELHQLADEIQQMTTDEPCCPLCEETICDEDCALAGIRDWEQPR